MKVINFVEHGFRKVDNYSITCRSQPWHQQLSKIQIDDNNQFCIICGFVESLIRKRAKDPNKILLANMAVLKGNGGWKYESVLDMINDAYIKIYGSTGCDIIDISQYRKERKSIN